MALTTTTHLNFPGTARQALNFYRSVFDGQVQMTTYKDLGLSESAPEADKIVFGLVFAKSGFTIMAYDIPGTTQEFFGETRRENGTTITDQPFFVSVSSDSLDELAAHWDKLAEGGKIVEPLAASEWSPGFGMITDRFGVTWTLSVAALG
ncbi:MAG: VOC family protein [Candidatus Nanopelagicales bacterium]